MKLEELVDKYYVDLNANDLYIWKYISQHKWDCQNLSIQELAKRCNISHMTIIRFAQKLKLKGYSELKVYLRWEANEQVAFDDKVIDDVSADYLKLIEYIKNQDFHRIFDMFDQADRIFIYGTGEIQKNVAKEFKRIFMYRQKIVHLIEGNDETAIISNFLTDKDVIILISLSGSSTLIKNFAHTLKQHGVNLISITRMEPNDLALIADENLYVTTRQYNTGRGSDLYGSNTSFFILIELLFMKYLQYEYKKDMLAKG